MKIALMLISLPLMASSALASPPAEAPSEGAAPPPDAAPPEVSPCALVCPEAADKTPDKAVFEIVLGTGLMFNASESFNYSDDVEVTPTSSVYLTGEVFLAPRWRVSLGYELPVGPQTRIVAGESEEKILPSVLELGVVAVPVWFDFAERSRIEVQLVANAGLTLASTPLAYPRVGFRLNFLQDAQKGIGLLFGINHSFRLGRIAFFYGAGYRF
jgi:hypothetical protein